MKKDILGTDYFSTEQTMTLEDLKKMTAIVNVQKTLQGIVVNLKTLKELKKLPGRDMLSMDKIFNFPIIRWGETPVYVKKYQRKVKLFYDDKELRKYLRGV